MDENYPEANNNKRKIVLIRKVAIVQSKKNRDSNQAKTVILI